MDVKDDLNKLNVEENLLKNSILSANTTFKAAFGATMGFYFAQFVATVLGLVLLGSLIAIVGLAFHFLK